MMITFKELLLRALENTLLQYFNDFWDSDWKYIQRAVSNEKSLKHREVIAKLSLNM